MITCIPIDNPPVYPEAIMADHASARELLADWPGNGLLLDVLRWPGIEPQHLIWLLGRVLPDRQARALALLFATRTPLGDGRVTGDLLVDEQDRHAIATVTRYCQGQASVGDLYRACPMFQPGYILHDLTVACLSGQPPLAHWHELCPVLASNQAAHNAACFRDDVSVRRRPEISDVWLAALDDDEDPWQEFMDAESAIIRQHLDMAITAIQASAQAVPA